MAKRYGKLPSELTKADLKEIDFNLLVAGAGIKSEAEQAKKAVQKAKRGKRK